MIKNTFNKNISIIRLIVIILMLVAVVISGTFAWLTYSSKKTALVLTIGDINDTQIKLSPYQVNGSIVPSTTYSGGVSSNIDIYKGNNDRTSFALFYKINQLDLVLINKGLSYTIVNTIGTEDVSDDLVVKTSTFKTLLGGDVTTVPESILVFDSNIDATVTAGTSTYYKIYLWVNSSLGSQEEIQGTSLDVELNASIGSVKFVGEPIIGTTLSTVIKDSVVDDTTTYTYQWYSNANPTTTGGTLIEGATESSYVVPQELDGKYLYVVVTSSKGITLSAVTTTYVQSDYVNPVVTIGSLSGTDVSLGYSDSVGVTKYYFGTSNPDATTVTWTDIESTTSGSVDKTVSTAGKYYFAAQDASGNKTTSSFDLSVGTFYYYNGSAQASTVDRCIIYSGSSSCNYSLPSAISSSTGLNSATYYGVSTSTSSNTVTTSYTSANSNYYAVYKGSWTATYTKGTGVSSIGATSNSCTNYETTNGTTYSSTSCSVTLPAITANSGYSVLGWYNSSDTKVGDAGGSLSLSANGTYTAKAELAAYSEPILNGAAPVLTSGLIPVTISNTGVVTTADVSSEWYSYEDKQWANAVLVNNTSRSSYYESDGLTIKPNQTIPEDNILAYFVWIPKYSYQISGTTVPSASISFNSTPSGYIEHPAFDFDGDKLGIWVGKFPAGHLTLDNSGNNLVCSNENCSNADGLIIKPNVSAKFSDKISYQFYASRSMERSGNPFGLVSSDVDTHMMKNSEWGAVAYLYISPYGFQDWSSFMDSGSNAHNSNITATPTGVVGEMEMTNVTGRGGNDIIYGEVESGIYPQSTTGNISGIFDMNGTAGEHVMGYYVGANSNYASNPSAYFGYHSSGNEAGFSSKPDEKYWDEYTTSDLSNSNVDNIGHAMSELYSWFESDVLFELSGDAPFFVRGIGGNNLLFTAVTSTGGAYSLGTFRVTLVVIE